MKWYDVWYKDIEGNSVLVDALNAAAPNGRDYYPQGNDAFTRASVEHTARLDALKKIHAEINTIVEAIDEQVEAKRNR